MFYLFFFFFSSRRRHTRSLRDWSSDVCSSDLDAFARNPELPPDRLERRRVAVAVQAIAHLQNVALALGQLGHRPPQYVLLQADADLFLGRRLLAREEIAERALVRVADRPVEARHRPSRLAHLAELLERQPGPLRDLLVGRRATELGRELALGPREPLLALHDVDGNPDRAGLVRDSALHGLPDPPGRVRRELEPAAPVELLDRPDQPDDPLLNQVEQRQVMALVALGDRDDEPEVRVDHSVLRLLVPALDPFRELAVDVGALLGLAAAVVGHLDPALVELVVDPAHLVVVELVLGDELVEARQVDAAEPLSLGDQRRNRFFVLGIAHCFFFIPDRARLTCR